MEDILDRAYTHLSRERSAKSCKRMKKSCKRMKNGLPLWAYVNLPAKSHLIQETSLISPSANITELLQAWTRGDPSVLQKLTPLVYAQLHRLAVHYMAAEPPDHTLQPTALVHETYLRLIDSKNIACRNRHHFFALSARMMRRILVDFARSRRYAKRGGGKPVVPLEEIEVFVPQKAPYLVALDEALSRLAEIDARKSNVVEMRVFSGLTVEETAAVLNVSRDTVLRDWKIARLWLMREIETIQSHEF